VVTTIDAGNEILEGGPESDRLFGDATDNPLIIGREGNDLIRGGGGDDILRGMEGADLLFGDAGADVLLGEAGQDVLRAQDSEQDLEINCGPHGDQAFSDGVDPAPVGC
jgi:Ca2+-binding RTX toxin-like protein